MSNLTTIDAIEKTIVGGDLSGLTSEQRLVYYQHVCKSLGLNTLTKPLEFIKMNGKLVLYAKRDATDQLRKIHGVSITKIEKSVESGICTVTAYAKDANGKEDSDMGAVLIEGLKGEALANAFMKCTTKAKRRVTLSICGLGLLDETEVETVVDSQTPQAPTEPKNVTPITPSKPLPPTSQYSSPFDHDTFETYVIPFGKWKGQKLVDVNVYDISSYYAFIERDAFEKGKEITGQVAAFMTHAKEYINSRSASGEDIIA